MTMTLTPNRKKEVLTFKNENNLTVPDPFTCEPVPLETTVLIMSKNSVSPVVTPFLRDNARFLAYRDDINSIH